MSEVIDKKQLNRDIFRLILPSVAENMLQLLAGTVITAMVGLLATNDIAAQNLSNQIYRIGFALFRGLGVGATVMVATYYGSQALGKCRRTVEQSYLTAIPIALAMVAVIVLIPGPLLSIFKSDPEVLGTAVDYSRITAWAIPFMAINCFNTAAFNGHGDTRTPMFIAIALNIVNVVTGYVFIFGIGGFGGWGITGAAIASLITQISGTALGLFLLYRPGGLLAMELHDDKFFKLEVHYVKGIFATGMPAALEHLFWQFSSIVMSRVILGYGTQYYAAYQLGLQAEMLTEMPAAGFVIASTTLTARAIGQRDGKLMRGYFSQLCKMAGILSIAATAVLFLAPSLFMNILTDKADLREIGAWYVFVMGFSQIPQVMSKVLGGVIRAAGGKRVPMFISFAGIWLIRVPLVVLAGMVFKLNITYIWAIISADQISRLLMAVVYMKRKNVLHYIERTEAQQV